MQYMFEFIRDASREGASLPDDFQAAFVAAALRKPNSTRWLPGAADNFIVGEAVIEACISKLPLSRGAISALRQKRRAFDVLPLIGLDMEFRRHLRMAGRSNNAEKNAEIFIVIAKKISVIATLDETSSSIEQAILARRPEPAPAARVPASDKQAGSILAVVSAALGDAPLPAPAAGRTPWMTPQWLEALQMAGGVPAAALDTLRDLAVDPRRIVLLLLMRAHERGEMPLRIEARNALRLEAATVAAALGSHRTALRWVEAAVLHEAGADSPSPDHIRAHAFFARCLARTGEGEAAWQHIRRAMLLHPASPALLAEAFTVAVVSHPEAASELARAALLSGADFNAKSFQAFAELLADERAMVEAQACLMRAARRGQGLPEHLLCSANLAQRHGAPEVWFSLLQQFGVAAGMPLDRFEPRATSRAFCLIGAGSPAERHDDLISVIMPAYNAAPTIECAARSVMAQLGCDFELIIVDDASTDRTPEIAAGLAASDTRVRVVTCSHNAGAYGARNAGIGVARGSILTFHDADDWMHPLKLNRQLSLLKQGRACTTSDWIRTRRDGRIMQRQDGGYVHLNPASTMFRRELIDQIGPFDRVRAGADAEFLSRIRIRYGWDAVAHAPQCLAIGLHHEASLTQSGPAAMDRHRFSRLRLDYAEAWLDRHLSELESGERTRPEADAALPFVVPAASNVETATGASLRG